MQQDALKQSNHNFYLLKKELEYHEEIIRQDKNKKVEKELIMSMERYLPKYDNKEMKDFYKLFGQVRKNGRKAIKLYHTK